MKASALRLFNAQSGERRPDRRLGFLGSRLLGLSRSVIIAKTFGTRLWNDLARVAP
jgi:hypothetical protein